MIYAVETDLRLYRIRERMTYTSTFSCRDTPLLSTVYVTRGY